MIKFATTFAILAIAGLAGCGDGGGQSNGQSTAAAASNAGPDRVEGKMEQAKLEAFSAFLPKEVNGWIKDERLGYYMGASDSTATATYRKAEGGESFAVVITFSNNIIRQTKEFLADPKQAETWGFEIGDFAGYPALFGKPGTNMAGTPYVIVLSNSRSVQVMYNATGGLTLDTIRPVVEKVDFKGIADK